MLPSLWLRATIHGLLVFGATAACPPTIFITTWLTIETTVFEGATTDVIIETLSQGPHSTSTETVVITRDSTLAVANKEGHASDTTPIGPGQTDVCPNAVTLTKTSTSTMVSVVPTSSTAILSLVSQSSSAASSASMSVSISTIETQPSDGSSTAESITSSSKSVTSSSINPDTSTDGSSTAVNSLTPSTVPHVSGGSMPTIQPSSSSLHNTTNSLPSRGNTTTPLTPIPTAQPGHSSLNSIPASTTITIPGGMPNGSVPTFSTTITHATGWDVPNFPHIFTPAGVNNNKDWIKEMGKFSCEPPCTQVLPVLTLATKSTISFWPITVSFCVKLDNVTYMTARTFENQPVWSEVSFYPITIPATFTTSGVIVPYYTSTQPPITIRQPFHASICPFTDNISDNGKCGNIKHKDVLCPYMQCCGIEGKCGTDGDHCGLEKGCQTKYGSCWTNSSSGFLPLDDHRLFPPDGLAYPASNPYFSPFHHGNGVFFIRFAYCWDCDDNYKPLWLPGHPGPKHGGHHGGGGCFLGICPPDWFPKIWGGINIDIPCIGDCPPPPAPKDPEGGKGSDTDKGPKKTKGIWPYPDPPPEESACEGDACDLCSTTFYATNQVVFCANTTNFIGLSSASCTRTFGMLTADCIEVQGTTTTIYESCISMQTATDYTYLCESTAKVATISGITLPNARPSCTKTISNVFSGCSVSGNATSIFSNSCETKTATDYTYSCSSRNATTIGNSTITAFTTCTKTVSAVVSGCEATASTTSIFSEPPPSCPILDFTPSVNDDQGIDGNLTCPLLNFTISVSDDQGNGLHACVNMSAPLIEYYEDQGSCGFECSANSTLLDLSEDQGENGDTCGGQNSTVTDFIEYCYTTNHSSGALLTTSCTSTSSFRTMGLCLNATTSTTIAPACTRFSDITINPVPTSSTSKESSTRNTSSVNDQSPTAFSVTIPAPTPSPSANSRILTVYSETNQNVPSQLLPSPRSCISSCFAPPVSGFDSCSLIEVGETMTCSCGIMPSGNPLLTPIPLVTTCGYRMCPGETPTPCITSEPGPCTALERPEELGSCTFLAMPPFQGDPPDTMNGACNCSGATTFFPPSHTVCGQLACPNQVRSEGLTMCSNALNFHDPNFGPCNFFQATSNSLATDILLGPACGCFDPTVNPYLGPSKMCAGNWGCLNMITIDAAATCRSSPTWSERYKTCRLITETIGTSAAWCQCYTTSINWSGLFPDSPELITPTFMCDRTMCPNSQNIRYTIPGDTSCPISPEWQSDYSTCSLEVLINKHQCRCETSQGATITPTRPAIQNAVLACGDWFCPNSVASSTVTTTLDRYTSTVTEWYTIRSTPPESWWRTPATPGSAPEVSRPRDTSTPVTSSKV